MKQIKLLFSLIFILGLTSCESESITQLEEDSQAKMTPYNINENSKFVWNEKTKTYHYKHEVTAGEEITYFEWNGELVKNYLPKYDDENNYLARPNGNSGDLVITHVTTYYNSEGQVIGVDVECQQSNYNAQNDTYGQPYDIACP